MRLLSPTPRRPLAPGPSREERALELAAMAFGATCPGMVVAALGSSHHDLPARIAAIRKKHPQWFRSTAAPDATAAADEASPRASRNREDEYSRCSLR